MERIVKNLQGLGFRISVDDCLKASGGETVGRPHIVRALNTYPENGIIIDNLRAEMEQAAVRSASVAMDYAHMLERPASDYPYRLFLSDDAFVPGVYVDYLYTVDMDAAVKLIRDAGGLAVVAHWYTVSRKIEAPKLEDMIRSGRVDGVELMGNPLNSAAQRALPVLRAMAERTGCAVTYGVDGHREQDVVNFVSDRELAGRTTGQTVRLIEKTGVSLEWSNLS
jgi:hypothetical protein